MEDSRVNLREAPTFHASKKDLRVLQRVSSKGKVVKVTYGGVFRVAQVGRCFGQACLSYELEVDELISATPSTFKE